jgi:hypothetical protein
MSQSEENMKPGSLMPTVLAVVSALAIIPAGCGGIKGTTTVPDNSISGKITYAGNIKPTHQIIVIAVEAGQQAPTYTVVISKPGPYTIYSVADCAYTVFAFMDLGDDMGAPKANEPSAYYDFNKDGQADEVTIIDGKGVTGIDIKLLDPK